MSGLRLYLDRSHSPKNIFHRNKLFNNFVSSITFMEFEIKRGMTAVHLTNSQLSK